MFAHHKEVLDRLQAAEQRYLHAIRTIGVPPGSCVVRIDGGTSAADRAAAVRTFQEEGSCRLALLSIKAAGVGAPLPVVQSVSLGIACMLARALASCKLADSWAAHGPTDFTQGSA